MEKRNDLLKTTVKEVTAGIGLLGILELLICVLFVGGGPGTLTVLKVRSMGGVILGCLFAAGWFLHMKQSLKKAAAMEEKRVPFQMRKLMAKDVFQLLRGIASLRNDQNRVYEPQHHRGCDPLAYADLYTVCDAQQIPIFVKISTYFLPQRRVGPSQ